MDPDKQTEKALKRHEKGRLEGQTCIECHFAIAHTEPDGPGPQEIFSAKAAPADAPASAAKAVSTRKE
jgi:cytochrome c-type protein NapC